MLSSITKSDKRIAGLEQVELRMNRLNGKLFDLRDKGLIEDEAITKIQDHVDSKSIDEVFFYCGPNELTKFLEETTIKRVATYNEPGDKYVEVDIQIISGQYTPNKKDIKYFKHTTRTGEQLETIIDEKIELADEKADYNEPIVANVNYTIYKRPHDKPAYELSEYQGHWDELHIYYPNKLTIKFAEGEK